MNYSNACTMVFNAAFPAGVSMGASSSSNVIEIDINGLSEPVLRGTSLAGVLRHIYQEHYGESRANALFGEATNSGTKKGLESRIRFYDTILDPGSSTASIERTCNSIDRHWGRVLPHSLFSFYACPPGTKAFITIDLYSENKSELEEEVENISSILHRTVLLGGNSNRGIGLMEIAGKLKVRYFNLQDVSDHSEYLDFRRKLKTGKINDLTELQEIQRTDKDDEDLLLIKLSFAIPEGQDILVGNGSMEPQHCTKADGKDYWILPGSSLRGVLRSYVTNLAARQGENVAYSFDRLPEKKTEDDHINSEQGWLFEKPSEGSERNHGLHEKYPVASLFGSLHKAGRLFISDAFVPLSEDFIQERAHVAVDSVTGGAIEGMLFRNSVVVSEVSKTSLFETYIRIEKPEERDIRWIVSGLKAIHSGFLRIGSSKASGRLVLAGDPCITGRLKDKFIEIWMEMS